MKVVIGLGNPGKKYERTRHNMGFIAVDSLRKKFNLNDEREKFHEFKWKCCYRDYKFL